MVISTLKTTNWIEFYGLSILETLSLEFSDYTFMVNELRKYSAEIKSGSDKIKEKLAKEED